LDGELILLDFIAQVRGKRIVLFGAGMASTEFLRDIPVDVAYVVDNDSQFWGGSILGHEVKPDRLRMTSTFMKLPAQGVFDIMVLP